MNTDVDNSYTLITGASAGIGKQLAIEFAKRKSNLFLIALPKSGLESFSQQLRDEFNIEVNFLCMNLVFNNSPKKVYSYAKEHNIQVNVLVNNAGVGFEGKFENLAPEKIDQILLLNVRATTMLTYYFLPHLKNAEKAHILNISSFAGMTPIPYKSLYSASKGFVWYFSQALNEELKDTHIKVLSVFPSGVKTERTLDKIKKSSMLAKITTMYPTEVAEMAVSSLYKGKEILIPGAFTKMYYVLGYILPQGLVLKLSSLIFRKYP